MKYISFYSDEHFYYCYFENGKIYRGMNAKKFTPNLIYFVLIFITLFLGDAINDILEGKLNVLLCLYLTFVGIVLSYIVGCVIYNNIEKKAYSELKEIFLLDTQFNEYISKGKKQFEIQKTIIAFMCLSTICLFFCFCFSYNLFFLLTGVVMCFASTLSIKWIKPLQKNKFYKTVKKK